jgi:hypothetical protein
MFTHIFIETYYQEHKQGENSIIYLQANKTRTSKHEYKVRKNIPFPTYNQNAYIYILIKNVFTFQTKKNQINTSVGETHIHATITSRQNTRKHLYTVACLASAACILRCSDHSQTQAVRRFNK